VALGREGDHLLYLGLGIEQVEAEVELLLADGGDYPLAPVLYSTIP